MRLGAFGSRVRPLPGWITGAVVAGTFLTLAVLEARRPLRRRVEPQCVRTLRNLAIAVLSATAIRVTEKPVADQISRMVVARRWGLLQRRRLPLWVEDAAGVVLLDYTLYVWHVLTHKVPLLWRLHAAHHADLDLDASTALRFHFVEMVLSVPWRSAQIVVVGASPRTLSIWQTATLVAILFHHSNLELPVWLERWLCRLVTTPRMHGIHHSIVPEETGSNWSTIFSFPDFLHGTIRLNVPQHEITIGIPAYRRADGLGLAQTLAMPFGEQRPMLLPEGVRPRRREMHALPPHVLAETRVELRRGWKDVVS